jgi:hypothetical protein
MTWPLLLLPLMDFSFSEIPSYLKGLEFRALIAAAITQIISGVADAVLIGVIQQAFGVTLS